MLKEVLEEFLVNLDVEVVDVAIDKLEEAVQDLEPHTRVEGLVLNIIRTYNMTTDKGVKYLQLKTLKQVLLKL